MGRRSIAFWGFAAIVVAGGIAWGLWPRPLPVDTGAVERGPLVVTVKGEGKTRVRDMYVVAAPVAGLMRRIELATGDSVTANSTILVTIVAADPTILDARARAQAEAGIRAAEAALSLAEAELVRAVAGRDFAIAEMNRTKALVDSAAASQRALERATMDLRTARAIVATAEAAVRVQRSELDTARAALNAPGRLSDAAMECCVSVRAPVSGRVLRLIEQSEKPVTAGTPLIELGDPARLEIVVDLLSRDVMRLYPGAAAVVRRWGGAVDLAARVRRIDPAATTKVSALGIEEQRVDAVLDILTPENEWTGLGHGYQVDVEIVSESRADVLKVPVSALFRSGTDWAVFTARDRARLQRVEIGLRTDRDAEVLAGLSAGDRVVLYPSDKVRNGLRIHGR